MTKQLQAIRYTRDGGLAILNQLLLPHAMVYEEIHNTREGFDAIKSMKVRGAPAIAIVAALALSVELNTLTFANGSEAVATIVDRLEYLRQSRPTAVNLSNAIHELKERVSPLATQPDPQCVVDAYQHAAQDMLARDVRDNTNIGELGAEWLVLHSQQQQQQQGGPLTVLTHCNTGSLATAGYGTAIGVIHSLHARQQLSQVYCTETRPYMQGARLTAYELSYANIPTTLICDSMVASLFASRTVHAVLVGADRVVRNGDTANKIGTMQIAVLAKQFHVPFIVCAPWTTIDLETATGKDIVIEERGADEVKKVLGVDQDGTRRLVQVADPQVSVWNPAFDVTPAEWIDAIVTDKQVFVKQPDGTFHLNG